MDFFITNYCPTKDLILLCRSMKWYSISTLLFYRPRSEGDNVLRSVRPSVRLFVRLCALSCLNRLTYDLDIWYGGRP